jgi:hypothetical protein
VAYRRGSPELLIESYLALPSYQTGKSYLLPVPGVTDKNTASILRENGFLMKIKAQIGTARSLLRA